MPCARDASSPAADDDPHPSNPESPGPPKVVRVLVVDNDARVRTAMRETIGLEADLAIVGAAADAPTALALATASADRSVVALVDVLLPDEGTGLSLVRSLSRLPRCPVVAMSVRSALRDAALAAGAVAFVEKGNDIDGVLRAVRSAAGRRASRDDASPPPEAMDQR